MWTKNLKNGKNISDMLFHWIILDMIILIAGIKIKLFSHKRKSTDLNHHSLFFSVYKQLCLKKKNAKYFTFQYAGGGG